MRQVFPTPESPSTITFTYRPDDTRFLGFCFRGSILCAVIRIYGGIYLSKSKICFLQINSNLSTWACLPITRYIQNKFIEMKKSKSFSTYGKYLQTRASLTTNPQILMRSTERAQKNPLKVVKTQPKWIEGFDRITGRDRPNSFLLFNTRDFCTQANYERKEDTIRTKNSFYPLRRESQERLNMLIYNKNFEKSKHVCKKCPDHETRDEKILTTRDLQNLRKSHHSMDFNKQSDRKNTYIKKPVGQDHSENMEASGMKSMSDFKAPKLVKVHSFDSYTKRDFLSQKKLSMKGAPFYSGAESYKVPLEKYKGGWKTITPQEFSKSPKKALNRYDATNDPFYTKLGYLPKENLTTKRTPIIDISQQIPRQMNQVHSRYPMRLAV